MTDATDALLTERAKTHGSFTEVAWTAQTIKNQLASMFDDMSPPQHEALDMIASKLARIACGDAHHRDHWDDIAGYARLGAMACKPASATERPPTAPQAVSGGNEAAETERASTGGSGGAEGHLVLPIGMHHRWWMVKSGTDGIGPSVTIALKSEAEADAVEDALFCAWFATK